MCSHTCQPAQPGGHRDCIGHREARRYGEAVANIALALADELVVYGQYQGVITGLRCAFDELCGEVAFAIDKNLHPAWAGCGFCQCFKCADRAVTQAERSSATGGCAGGAAFTIGMKQPGQASRAYDDGLG